MPNSLKTKDRNETLCFCSHYNAWVDRHYENKVSGKENGENSEEDSDYDPESDSDSERDESSTDDDDEE